ncbi:MAG: hypothetical protein ACTS6G_04200 [Candidatus Hodgkinia cicadicola]
MRPNIFNILTLNSAKHGRKRQSWNRSVHRFNAIDVLRLTKGAFRDLLIRWRRVLRFGGLKRWALQLGRIQRKRQSPFELAGD